MTKEVSSKINNLFSSSVIDVTPPAARSIATVLYVSVSNDSVMTNTCAAILSKDERDRAAEFIADGDRDNFLQRRAFQRFCAARALEQMEAPEPSHFAFAYTENGRPYLDAYPELWFSFSTSRTGFLGAWSPTQAIGVDLEDPARMGDAPALARQFFSAPEALLVETLNGAGQAQACCRLWCLKEAALKSIGEGLPFGLEAFQFDLSPAPRLVQSPEGHGSLAQFRAYEIEGTGGCAGFVSRRWRT